MSLGKEIWKLYILQSITIHNVLPAVLSTQDICIILQHPQCRTVVLEIKHTVYLWVLIIPNLDVDYFTKC